MPANGKNGEAELRPELRPEGAVVAAEKLVHDEGASHEVVVAALLAASVYSRRKFVMRRDAL